MLEYTIVWHKVRPFLGRSGYIPILGELFSVVSHTVHVCSIESCFVHCFQARRRYLTSLILKKLNFTYALISKTWEIGRMSWDNNFLPFLNKKFRFEKKFIFGKKSNKDFFHRMKFRDLRNFILVDFNILKFKAYFCLGNHKIMVL